MKNLFILIASMWLLSMKPIESNLLPKVTISQATLKGQKDVAKYLQGKFDKAAYQTAFILPEGEYHLKSPLLITDKSIFIIGGGGIPGLKTHFLVDHTEPALTITRKKVGSTAVIENIMLSNRQNVFLPSSHGIVLSVPTIMKNVVVSNFGGDGIYLWGDGGSGRPESGVTDVSFCHFESVRVEMCRGDGISIRGGDANASHFEHIDVRDNWGHGIKDASFLGNSYVSCMAHMNRLGNYFITDINNRSTLTGCYSEGGSPPDYFDGEAQIFGGLWGSDLVLQYNAIQYTYGLKDREPVRRAPFNTHMRKVMSDGVTVVTLNTNGTFPKEEDVKLWTVNEK